jgi:hypothetical protein
VRDGQAVVVLPAGVSGLGSDLQLRRWLSRGTMSMQPLEHEMLAEVLSVIEAPIPDEGFAALRFWGQTGERSSRWMAAADPVHYQARMRDVRLCSLPADQNTASDIREIFTSLHTKFGADGECPFVRLGTHGYLLIDEPMNLPSVSAGVADGHVPDKFTASGIAAKAYHQLLGELQMFLHDHAVNLRRQKAGLPEINSLWLWGGGVAPEPKSLSMPDLYSADALFAGYWASVKGTSRPWLDFDVCLGLSPQGFVAVVGEESTEGLSAHLTALEGLLKCGKLKRLVVLFRDGLKVELDRFDRLRVWRGLSPLLARNIHDGSQ